MGLMSKRALVIVVENDAEAAAALALTLRDFGLEVAAGNAVDGLAAELRLRGSEVAAIITDYDLGTMPNGILAAEALRDLYPDTPVLVLSSEFTEKAAVAAAQAGFDYLQKPAGASLIADWLAGAGCS